MVERTDIDALLISALYGELTPVQESQLAAHLESHPADRTALADLTRTRAALHESRILRVQVDPPQAISAVLLQEAARRAPKVATEGETWFQRFLRSFMQHPAMAAAAMLVLVVGVAAAISRNGGGFAEQTVDTSAATSTPSAPRGPEAREAPAAAAPVGLAEGKMDDKAADAVGGAPADSFAVNLEDRAPEEPQANEQAGGKRKGTSATRGENQGEDQGKSLRDESSGDVARQGYGSVRGIALNKAAPQPKELDAAPPPPAPAKARAQMKEEALADGDLASQDSTRADLGYTGGAAGRGAAPKTTAKPSAVTPTMPAPSAAPTVTTGDERRSEEKKLAAKDASVDPGVAWARVQHDRLRALVQANNCAVAADVALAIADRAPAYYQQNVATDRAVKECNSYIAAKLEQRNELRAKSERAKKAAEPSAPKRAVTEPSK